MIVVCVVLYEPLICELNQLWRRLCFLVLHCRAVKGQVLANSVGLPWSLLGWGGDSVGLFGLAPLSSQEVTSWGMEQGRN